MARRIREEFVTRALVKWLDDRAWAIVSFDYPGSGTGCVIRPFSGRQHKNRDAIIPDIIAVKNGCALFFENKENYCPKDVALQEMLRSGSDYDRSFETLLKPYGRIATRFFGIGLADTPANHASAVATRNIDFVVLVSLDGVRPVHSAVAFG